MTTGLLNKIDSPKDIKNLNYDALKELAQEIRDYMIEVISKNGGHLAPNLGVVELTLALHKVFNCPPISIKLLPGGAKPLKRCASITDFPAFQKFRKASTMLLARAIPARRYRLRWAWRLRAI